MFGKRGANRDNFNLSNINGSNGFKLSGSEYLGYGIMESAGDVNGDGITDLAIGDYSAASNAGRAYILFGKNVTVDGEWNAVINVSTLNGSNGFIIHGSSSYQLGYSVVSAGDLNDDGFDDIFIGTYSGNAGGWIVFGHASPWTESPLNVSLLDGTDGFNFVGNKKTSIGEYLVVVLVM